MLQLECIVVNSAVLMTIGPSLGARTKKKIRSGQSETKQRR